MSAIHINKKKKSTEYGVFSRLFPNINYETILLVFVIEGHSSAVANFGRTPELDRTGIHVACVFSPFFTF